MPCSAARLTVGGGLVGRRTHRCCVHDAEPAACAVGGAIGKHPEVTLITWGQDQGLSG
jgi:hypothetical protein